jgi:hypothetical protein
VQEQYSLASACGSSAGWSRASRLDTVGQHPDVHVATSMVLCQQQNSQPVAACRGTVNASSSTPAAATVKAALASATQRLVQIWLLGCACPTPSCGAPITTRDSLLQLLAQTAVCGAALCSTSWQQPAAGNVAQAQRSRAALCVQRGCSAVCAASSFTAAALASPLQFVPDVSTPACLPALPASQPACKGACMRSG